MARKGFSIDSIGITRLLQILIAVLFICMGIIGFSTSRGLGDDLSRGISKVFGGGDRELLTYIISTVELLCGIVLGATLFVKALPSNITTLAMNVVWIVWLAIIVLLDVISVGFNNLEGIEWLIWLQEIVLHLIVLAGILQVCGRTSQK